MAYQIVDAQYVMDQLGKMPIVDVRPLGMYAQGHIPDAVHVGLMEAQQAAGDTAQAFLDGFAQAGIDPAGDLIIYCQSGHLAKEACDLLEARGYAGQRCYEGSWLDWTGDPSRPVEV